MSQSSDEQVLQQLTSFRQYQRDSKRVPHKPLLVLMALGRLDGTGSSAIPWNVAETQLADLITEFGPPSRTGRAQSAAYIPSLAYARTASGQSITKYRMTRCAHCASAARSGTSKRNSRTPYGDDQPARGAAGAL